MSYGRSQVIHELQYAYVIIRALGPLDYYRPTVEDLVSGVTTRKNHKMIHKYVCMIL